MSSKDAAQQTVFVAAARRGSRPSKGSPGGGLASILFPVVHLLEKLLRFLLVRKR